MTRSPMPSSAGGRWSGLVVDVRQPIRPGLRVEVASGRRMLLRQDGRVVLLARQRSIREYQGRVEHLRAPADPFAEVRIGG